MTPLTSRRSQRGGGKLESRQVRRPPSGAAVVWLATVCRVVGDKAKEFSSGGRVAEDAGEVVGEGKGGG